MPAHDQALDDSVREIAKLLATAHLRLRFQDQPNRIDSPESMMSQCGDQANDDVGNSD